MEELSPELVQLVYKHCTPTRRKSLLSSNRQVNHGIRENARGCITDIVASIDFPSLPDKQRFPRLHTVCVKCTAEQLSAVYGGSGFVVFEASTEPLMCFDTPDEYRCGVPTLLLGVPQATFQIRTQQDALAASAIVQRARGLQSVRFHAHGTFAAAVEVRNPELWCLSVRGGSRLPSLSLARLTLLEVECPELKLQASHLQTLRHLTGMCVRVKYITRDLPMLPSLRVVYLHVLFPSYLCLRGLSQLQYLTLTNVRVTHTDLATELPALRTVSLYSSWFLEHQLPNQLLASAGRLQALQQLNVIYLAPGPLHRAAWEEVQDATGAKGYCDPDAVNLTMDFTPQRP